MLINPGTWRKALPLSKSKIRKLAVPALLLFPLFTFGAGIIESGEGEEEIPAAEVSEELPVDGPAILISGPDPGKSLLFLPPNVLEFVEARYTHGTATIVIQFVEETVFTPDSWVPVRCNGEILRFTLEGESLHYSFEAEEGWTIFFDFPVEYTQICVFVTRFLQRLRYFFSVSEPDVPVPFPAVLYFVD